MRSLSTDFYPTIPASLNWVPIIGVQWPPIDGVFAQTGILDVQVVHALVPGVIPTKSSEKVDNSKAVNYNSVISEY
jgi:hypothetical protein